MATDIEKRAAGLKAILYFHEQSQNYSNYPFMNNVQGLYDQIDAISPTWLKNFGNAILATNMDTPPWYSSISLLQSNMQTLADTLQGKAPATQEGLQLFFDSIQGEFDSVLAQIKQVGEGVFSDSYQAGKTAFKVAGAAVVGFAAYKVAVLAVAGLGLIFAMYKYMRPQKTQNPKRKIRKRK